MGHKGPVLRSRCVGPEPKYYSVLFYHILKYGLKSGSSRDKKFPHILYDPKANYRNHNSRQSVLSQINAVHAHVLLLDATI